MFSRQRALALAAVVLAAVLSACGDGGDMGSPSPTPPAGMTVRLASLNGSQETPAVSTTAFGAGMFALDEATGRIRGFIVTSGLVNATAAHIHPGARGAANAPIVTLNGGPSLWVVPDDATLNASQIAQFRAGTLYVNAHTQANTNGEIRGQIDKTGTVKLAALNGAQETPAVNTQAFGAGVLSVDAATGAVAGFIVTSGLVDSTAAHVHPGARGAANSPIVPLSGGPSLWVVPDGQGPLTADQRGQFTAGNLYVNAHTQANTNGEIRGQLDKAGTLKLASMNGAQETPPVVGTQALGAGVLSVADATGAVAGFIVTSGLVNSTAAHVHPGARGASNPPIVPLSGGPDMWIVPDGQGALTANQQGQFTAGTLYVNAHTQANTNGEIRGQLD